MNKRLQDYNGNWYTPSRKGNQKYRCYNCNKFFGKLNEFRKHKLDCKNE